MLRWNCSATSAARSLPNSSGCSSVRAKARRAGNPRSNARGNNLLAGEDLGVDRLFVGVGLDDLVVQAVERQLEPVAHAELVVDLAQVVLDHLLGGAELEGDLLVALALRDAGNDRHLLRREPRLVLRAHQRGGLSAISLDYPVH